MVTNGPKRRKILRESQTTLTLKWWLPVLAGISRAQSFPLTFRPPPLSEELGCSPTLTVLSGRSLENGPPVYFDPLQIATDENFSWLREAELKHGRVAMLANAETLFLPLLDRIRQIEIAPSETGAAVVTTNSEMIMKPYRPASLLQSFQELTLLQVLSVVLTCALLETVLVVQRDRRDMPGDYGWGYFGVRDKGLHERELIMELEHGRLAMLGIVSQFLAEVWSGGQSWEEQWIHVLRDLVRDWLSKI